MNLSRKFGLVFLSRYYGCARRLLRMLGRYPKKPFYLVRYESQHMAKTNCDTICQCNSYYNCIIARLDPLSILVYSQVILSLMIPLPMIPLVLLTRNKGVMGEFVNRNITTITAIVFVGIILAFNSYLIITTIKL